MSDLSILTNLSIPCASNAGAAVGAKSESGEDATKAFVGWAIIKKGRIEMLNERDSTTGAFRVFVNREDLRHSNAIFFELTEVPPILALH